MEYYGTRSTLSIYLFIIFPFPDSNALEVEIKYETHCDVSTCVWSSAEDL